MSTSSPRLSVGQTTGLLVNKERRNSLHQIVGQLQVRSKILLRIALLVSGAFSGKKLIRRILPLVCQKKSETTISASSSMALL